MNKKAQAQIITTVLIILLVLAAVVIVWQVVNTTVTKGAKEVQTKSSCLGLTLDIESATTAETDNVQVRRGTGGPATVKVYVIPTGAEKVPDTVNTAELGLATLSVSDLAVDQEIKAGAELTDGTLCPPIATAKVTAPTT